MHNPELRISIYQMDIIWEKKDLNLNKLEKELDLLKGKTDLIVLPEMFTTGFSMNPEILAETISGNTISSLKAFAKQYDLAICGSFIAKENNNYFNRAFFVTNEQVSFYDKRHLFRMSNESEKYTAGNDLTIVSYKDFNICLQICYDLRFPVWVRNTNNRYDLLIYIANWPKSRIKAWNVLLQARALENAAYVCGINRIGKDDNGLIYNGQSALLNYNGEKLLSFDGEDDKESVKTQKISKKELNLFRDKFPIWKDADKFYLK